jgi:uncharacterized membrane protein YesL
MDGKFLETFNKITDLVTLNILWLLCCIPIITIGASTSALYQVTLQIAENRDSYITKEFFKAFRENFRQATIVWLAVIVTGFVLLSDMFIISHFFTGSDMSVILGLIFMILILLFAGSMYFFPVIAYFRNSTKKIFSNSFRLAFSNLRTTFQLFLIGLIPALVMILFHERIIIGTFLLIVIVPALSVFCKSVLLSKLFKTIKVAN